MSHTLAADKYIELRWDGNSTPLDSLQFSESAKKALQLARQEAARIGDKEIDPRHILLALIKAQSAELREFFDKLGLGLRKVRDETKLWPGHDASRRDL